MELTNQEISVLLEQFSDVRVSDLVSSEDDSLMKLIQKLIQNYNPTKTVIVIPEPESEKIITVKFLRRVFECGLKEALDMINELRPGRVANLQINGSDAIARAKVVVKEPEFYCSQIRVVTF